MLEAVSQQTGWEHACLAMSPCGHAPRVPPGRVGLCRANGLALLEGGGAGGGPTGHRQAREGQRAVPAVLDHALTALCAAHCAASVHQQRGYHRVVFWCGFHQCWAQCLATHSTGHDMPAACMASAAAQVHAHRRSEPLGRAAATMLAIARSFAAPQRLCQAGRTGRRDSRALVVRALAVPDQYGCDSTPREWVARPPPRGAAARWCGRRHRKAAAFRTVPLVPTPLLFAAAARPQVCHGQRGADHCPGAVASHSCSDCTQEGAAGWAGPAGCCACLLPHPADGHPADVFTSCCGCSAAKLHTSAAV